MCNIKKSLLLLVLEIILTTGSACATPPTSEPVDKTWLSPGKMQISGVSPGEHVQQSITLHNGSEIAATFHIYYRTPDYVEDEFETAPVDAPNWITIEQESVSLAPKEKQEISIILDLPSDIQIPERWEFWIGVKPKEKNTLTAELCSRWLITMKDSQTP